MILTERTGDLLDLAEKGEVDVIVHQANLEHTFGAGIAKAIREKFPYAYLVDLTTPKGSIYKLGKFSVGRSSNLIDPIVVNMYSQVSLAPSITSYDAMVEALTGLREILWCYTSGKKIGFPYGIGCGLADGDWRIVKTIITTVFEDSDYEVVIVKLPENLTRAKESV